MGDRDDTPTDVVQYPVRRVEEHMQAEERHAGRTFWLLLAIAALVGLGTLGIWLLVLG